MPILTDIIPVWIIIMAVFVSGGMLWLLKTAGVFRTYFDPSIIVFFQIGFTYTILLLLGILPLTHLISFPFFVILIILLKDFKPFYNSILITNEEWLAFAKFLFIVVGLINIHLLITKGFILLQEDVGVAKVEFYQGVGFYKRINQMALIVFGVASFFFLSRKEYLTGTSFFLFTCYLILSMGSKGGLITFAFIYGGILNFQSEKKINYGKIIPFILIAFISSLFIFYLVYGDSFLASMGYRIISFSDGPVYYFYDTLEKYISYPIGYLVDQLFVGLRLRPDLSYEGLGPLINSYYFGYDNPMFGPNPQVFVESDVMFGLWAPAYYFIVAIIFMLSRNFASTPFAFLIIAEFFNPLLIDGNYAFSNLFNMIILGVLLFPYLALRKYFLYSIYNNRIKKWA